MTIALHLTGATRLLAGNAMAGRLRELQKPAFNFLPGSSRYPTPRLLWQECNWRIYGSFENWRRGRDSNPRFPFGNTRFPSARIRPLCHLSGVRLNRQKQFLRWAKRQKKGSAHNPVNEELGWGDPGPVSFSTHRGSPAQPSEKRDRSSKHPQSHTRNKSRSPIVPSPATIAARAPTDAPAPY